MCMQTIGSEMRKNSETEKKKVGLSAASISTEAAQDNDSDNDNPEKNEIKSDSNRIVFYLAIILLAIAFYMVDKIIGIGVFQWLLIISCVAILPTIYIISRIRQQNP